MSIFRNILLWCSENKWLRHNLPRHRVIKKAVKKFMPGETTEDAIQAAKGLSGFSIPTVFTKLGENITSLLEAYNTTEHYLKLLDDIEKEKLDTEISVKLTQIGFDLSLEETYKNIVRIITKSALMKKIVWIDMEGSSYTQPTINFYHRVKNNYSNVGLCLQAYLYRTEKDLAGLTAINANIRLVKGAYKEPDSVAFKSKSLVDENYFNLSKILLKQVKEKNILAAFATHDMFLIDRIQKEAVILGLDKSKFECQMLYGIRVNDQKKLAQTGNKVRVLISYGESWYPWYLRRLAERPANILFVIKNLF